MERKEEKKRLEKGKASTQNRRRQRDSGRHNTDEQSETEQGLCVQTGQGKPLIKAQQTEDAVMKTVMQIFAEELLPYLGIEGKAVRIAPTELVYLELKKLFQDFNLEMVDGTWKHFEFQSTNEGLKGLKRFRMYEAVTSYQYHVPVTTYVLFSGKIKNPMTEFTEGINTYRIHPVIMQHEDADKLIAELQRKMEQGESITKQDLIPMVLSPLMGGDSEIRERIQITFQAVRTASSMEPEEVQKLEAVMYAMAEKFLEEVDLEKLKEEIGMTRIGQMLVQEGWETGREAGWKVGQEDSKLEIAANLLDILDVETIAERVGLPVEKVIELKEGK